MKKMIKMEVQHRGLATLIVSDDAEVEEWADRQTKQPSVYTQQDTMFSRQCWADLAYAELRKIARVHNTVLWLTKCDVNRKMTPVVGDTDLKLGIIVAKSGKYATTMQNTLASSHGSSGRGLLLIAAMKHSGIFGTVVSVPSFALWRSNLVCADLSICKLS